MTTGKCGPFPEKYYDRVLCPFCRKGMDIYLSQNMDTCECSWSGDCNFCHASWTKPLKGEEWQALTK